MYKASSWYFHFLEELLVYIFREAKFLEMRLKIHSWILIHHSYVELAYISSSFFFLQLRHFKKYVSNKVFEVQCSAQGKWLNMRWENQNHACPFIERRQRRFLSVALGLYRPSYTITLEMEKKHLYLMCYRSEIGEKLQREERKCRYCKICMKWRVI